MKPFNYAVLHYFTTVNEACVDDVMEALQCNYGHFKAFNRKAIVSILMTAETNNILMESYFNLTPDGILQIYYKKTREGSRIINQYIN